MFIDMHTHVFPDALADRAVAQLIAGAHARGNETKNYIPATEQALLRSMEDNGVDLSVVLPVVTAPKQEDSVLRFAGELAARNQNLISFGGVIPGMTGWKDYLHRMKDEGFLGIKLHPEFQGCFVDSKESIALFKECEALGLLTVLHAGEDIGIQPPVHSTPEALSHVLEEVSGKYIIAAHMGGWNRWDEVEEYLVGSNLYFDTAFVKDFLSKEQYVRIIRSHGAEKILFGSDSPWEMPKDTWAAIKALGLTKEEEDCIAYGNAAKLLNLPVIDKMTLAY